MELIVPHTAHADVEDLHERYSKQADYLTELQRRHAAADDAYAHARRQAQESGIKGMDPVDLSKVRQAARDAEAQRDALVRDIKDQEAIVSALNDEWRLSMRRAMQKNREKAERLEGGILFETAEALQGMLDDRAAMHEEVKTVIVSNGGKPHFYQGEFIEIKRTFDDWCERVINKHKKHR